MRENRHAVFGRRILRARRRLDLTATEVARRAKMTKGSICNYEKGRRLPQALHLLRLAKVLGTTTDKLLAGL